MSDYAFLGLLVPIVAIAYYVGKTYDQTVRIEQRLERMHDHLLKLMDKQGVDPF